MHSEEYIEGAKKTEPSDTRYEDAFNRLGHINTMRLLHAGMGVSTEAGEFLDALKKYVFYGKPVDEVNLKEEIGDLFWYCAIACDVLGVNFESIMERNIDKLRARYPNNFTEDSAQNRDLATERKILEG